MKMFIFSKFGVLDCVPMTLQDIENSTLQAKEESIPTVTADKQCDMESASDNCCDLSPETPF